MTGGSRSTKSITIVFVRHFGQLGWDKNRIHGFGVFVMLHRSWLFRTMAFVVRGGETMGGWNWMMIRRVWFEGKTKVVVIVSIEERCVGRLLHLGLTHTCSLSPTSWPSSISSDRIN